MAEVVRARRGRPGLSENELVDLTEAAAIRTGVDLAVVTTKRRTIELKDPIYEVTLVQHLVQYLLMYPALDRFNIGWEVRIGRRRIDIVLESAQKRVFVECKDFSVGSVNTDARKLRRLIAAIPSHLHPAGYVLAFWRTDVPEDLTARVARHYVRQGGLDPGLTHLVAHKRFQIYGPDRHERDFGVALFQVTP